ncbi:YtxH domain-containing protein [Candidatus Woesebacteria bacterium]|nr:YtxH domain-containing protein [Candidatus Woesebacteria bacterium]
MNNIKKPDSHNFWSGFSLGAVAGGTLLYLFATKKGRKTLHSLLQSSESLEHDLEGLFQILQGLTNTPNEENKKEEAK